MPLFFVRYCSSTGSGWATSMLWSTESVAYGAPATQGESRSISFPVPSKWVT